MLPKELRTRRLALALSLEDLARRVHVEPSVIAAMENGDAPIPAAVIGTLGQLEEPRETVNSTPRAS
jgi:predicted transcriptional regulator